MKLTRNELIWLMQNGGRTEKYVRMDNGRKYVEMFNPNLDDKIEKVYIGNPYLGNVSSSKWLDFLIDETKKESEDMPEISKKPLRVWTQLVDFIERKKM